MRFHIAIIQAAALVAWLALSGLSAPAARGTKAQRDDADLLTHFFYLRACKNLVGFAGEKYRGAALAFIDQEDRVNIGDTFYVLLGSSAVARGAVTELIPASNVPWADVVETRNGLKSFAIVRSAQTDLSNSSDDSMLGIRGMPPPPGSIGVLEFSTRTSPNKGGVETITRATWILPYTKKRCYFSGLAYYPQGAEGDDKSLISDETFSCLHASIKNEGTVKVIMDINGEGRYQIFLWGGEALVNEYSIAIFDGKVITSRRLLVREIID